MVALSSDDGLGLVPTAGGGGTAGADETKLVGVTTERGDKGKEKAGESNPRRSDRGSGPQPNYAESAKVRSRGKRSRKGRSIGGPSATKKSKTGPSPTPNPVCNDDESDQQQGGGVGLATPEKDQHPLPGDSGEDEAKIKVEVEDRTRTLFHRLLSDTPTKQSISSAYCIPTEGARKGPYGSHILYMDSQSLLPRRKVVLEGICLSRLA